MKTLAATAGSEITAYYGAGSIWPFADRIVNPLFPDSMGKGMMNRSTSLQGTAVPASPSTHQGEDKHGKAD